MAVAFALARPLGQPNSRLEPALHPARWPAFNPLPLPGCDADKDDLPFSDPQRRGYEQLLRKLQRLPGAPAVVQV